jgi:ribose-phosphate pyrophosphokinase
VITAVHAFADEADAAGRLARALGTPLHLIELHAFPDGEHLPRVAPASGAVALYRSLWRPDDKIAPLLLAADALRRRGAARVILTAPYLCYMRQDAVFHPGEPLSRDVIGRLLGERFEAVVTVEPHLHRTRDIGAAFAGATVVVLPAAATLAAAFAPADPALVVIGPDSESAPWAAAVAGALGVRSMTVTKTRRGDRDVALTLDDRGGIAGRPILLVDDIGSSGATLEAALGALKAHHAGPVDIALAHALYDEAAGRRLAAAGARRVVSTDSCPHPTNGAPLAALLADALRDLTP